MSLTLSAALLVSAFGNLNSHSTDAPAQKCEISLSRWCILVFDGSIDLEGRIDTRTWKIQSRLEMKSGPILITEDRQCIDEVGDSKFVVSLAKSEKRDEKLIRTYKLGPGNCTLEFTWPAAGVSDPSYEQFINYGIHVGTSAKIALGEALRVRPVSNVPHPFDPP